MQTLYQTTITDRESADKLVANTITLTGVRWVDVNITQGSVMVTHDDDYDEASFKALAGI
ncbi:hypothetical protein KPY62_08590 [Psychrobacter sp. TAE2020]|uniref:hypothetical protein n=1 Tax=Psychrobacter sp. TAE2020 TaxID=2846762 RepID=UPI001C10C61C|nr:hypothetical protein [Psychrobacter sp. TAE2020]MBU5617144.1 hypothetical protein [Psychrobacter sp. TAE2020]